MPDLDLSLAVGSSPSWSIAIIDPENSNTAVNITGASFSFLVKQSPTDDDDDSIFILSSENGGVIITTALSGFAQIDNNAEDSALLEVGRWYYWYLRIELASGETRLARKGKLQATAF